MGLDKDLAGVQANHLDSGEEVLGAVQGTHVHYVGSKEHTRNGTLLATDRRVAFYRKKMGSGFDFDSFPYPTIASIEQGKNMMGHHIRLTVAGNVMEMKWIKDAAGTAKMVEAIRARLGQAVAAAAPAAAPDGAEQLRKLAELRDSGILTEEEFAAKKKEILERI
jgi:hypothetical protein